MKTKVEDLGPVKKRLEIEIEASEVAKKIDEAYRELKKGVKLPGFRPGKAPRNILERRFGSQVMEDVTRTLINETLPKAVEETKTFPLTLPVIENEILKADEKFKYFAVMEVRPEFELGDYIGLEVEKEICAVSDQDVENQLEEIRKAHGSLTSIEEDRGIRSNDYVVIDYEGIEGGKALEGVKNTNFLMRIGGQDFHPDFEKGLIGLKKGDKIEIKVDFEENYSHPKLAGKRVNFKVKVVDIKEMILPELGDTFARDLGADFEDLNDLKKNIKKSLLAQEESRIDGELKRRLMEKISDRVDFELPESLVASELNGTISRIRQNLVRSGSTMERAGLEEEKLREDLKLASEKKVKERLILEEIAKRDRLAINEAELSEGLKKMALNTGQAPEMLRKYYEANNLMESFKLKLLEEKTLNYLVKGARISEVEKVEMDKINREQE